MHHRNDETLLGLDCDADVVAVEQHKFPVVGARVQLRVFAQRLDDRLENERDEALQVDLREVALLDPCHGGDLAVGTRQVLEHLSAHATQWDTRPFRTRLGAWHRDIARRDGANILLRDPSLPARAGHVRQINA